MDFLASEAVRAPPGKTLCTGTPAMKVDSAGMERNQSVESSAATPVRRWSFFFVRLLYSLQECLPDALGILLSPGRASWIISSEIGMIIRLRMRKQKQLSPLI